MMPTHPFTVSGLGEIAIRCGDIDGMFAFYRDVIGLPVLSDTRENSGIAFFRLQNGTNGHTSVLALFRHDAGRTDLHPQGTAAPATGAGSSLHHIALSLPRIEQEKAIAHYEAISQAYNLQVFDWIGWRGLFTTDPEGNTVELVCFDKAFLAK